MPKRISKRKRQQLRTIRSFERYVESSSDMQKMYAEDRELAEIEQARIEARDDVTDEELLARMRGAPDLGGSTLIELSEFVRNRSKE